METFEERVERRIKERLAAEPKRHSITSGINKFVFFGIMLLCGVYIMLEILIAIYRLLSPFL